jgi:type IV secretion system protein TrbD
MSHTIAPVLRPVHRSINRPLRICGVDRRLFFLAVGLAAAVFNLFHTLLGGLLMWGLLYAFALWATARDPDFLRILLGSVHARRRFDPIKTSVSVWATNPWRNVALLKTRACASVGSRVLRRS